jgi:hypothetical protein
MLCVCVIPKVVVVKSIIRKKTPEDYKMRAIKRVGGGGKEKKKNFLFFLVSTLKYHTTTAAFLCFTVSLSLFCPSVGCKFLT